MTKQILLSSLLVLLALSNTYAFNDGINPYIMPAPINLNFDSLDKLDQEFLSNPKQGWFKYGSMPNDYTIGIDKGGGVNGTNAGTVISVNNKAKGFGALTQNFNAEKYLGKRIRITCYMRSKDLKHRSLFFSGAYGSTQKSFVYGNNHKSPLKGTKDWTKYEVVMDVPADATFITIGAELWGAGEIWLDNVSIEIVDNSVPATTFKDE